MTRVDIDDSLLEAARAASGRADPCEAVRAAVEEYLALVKRRELIDLFGTIDYYPGYPRRDKALPATYDGDENPD